MTREKTTPPPPETAATKSSADVHEPPSLPTSPLAKRTKTTPDNASDRIASVIAPSNGNGSGTAVTSISQPQPPLLVKKLTETATAPTRGSAFAAGYDLYAAKDTVIPAKGKGLVDTGLAIAVPEGTCTCLVSVCFLRLES